MEVLNRHLKKEHEILKVKNEIQKTKNEIMLHLGVWYDKNKKLKAKNKSLKRKVIILQHIILMKKRRMVVTAKKARRNNMNVLAQASEKPQCWLYGA